MLKHLDELQVKNKRVLIRADFNVPLDKEARITDDTRIREALPTIQDVLKRGGAVILMSHLGRPKGGRKRELSLLPVAKRLAELLGQPVQLADDCIGPEVKKLVTDLSPGQVLLLENLRFHAAEEHPEEDASFAQSLAALGDCFVNDAFGTAHRAHSSNVAIMHYFPGKCAAGRLMEKEISFLGGALKHPKRPFYALIGGAKISTKFGILEALKDRVDALLIGGGMAYTFLKANGIPIGNSIHEDPFLEQALQIQRSYADAGIPLLLPIDMVVTKNISEGGPVNTVLCSEGIPDGYEGVDIGPQTVSLFQKTMREAATLFWNGPVGVFEIPEYAKGTDAIARAVAELKGITIVGGGDSVAALNKSGLADKITHVSTGGGASLEFIEKGTLPALA